MVTLLVKLLLLRPHLRFKLLLPLLCIGEFTLLNLYTLLTLGDLRLQFLNDRLRLVTLEVKLSSRLVQVGHQSRVFRLLLFHVPARFLMRGRRLAEFVLKFVVFEGGSLESSL